VPEASTRERLSNFVRLPARVDRRWIVDNADIAAAERRISGLDRRLDGNDYFLVGDGPQYFEARVHRQLMSGPRYRRRRLLKESIRGADVLRCPGRLAGEAGA
jgi:hypothetical protein